MPLNQSVTMVIQDYLENERPGDETLSEENRDALFLSLQGKRMTRAADSGTGEKVYIHRSFDFPKEGVQPPQAEGHRGNQSDRTGKFDL